MKIEFLDNVSIYKSDDSIIRLFDFDYKQAMQFQNIIKNYLLVHTREVNACGIPGIGKFRMNLTQIGLLQYISLASEVFASTI